jgi:hypothetical protein
MIRQFKDLIAERATQRLIGRTAEMARLGRLLESDDPLVIHIHGIGGIGKSALLHAFAARARAQGATVALLDCRAIEPTERAFLQELGSAIGGNTESLDETIERLVSLGTPVVLLLDTYEVFRTMDTWLRQSFVPVLPENVRIVLSGREPPVPAWLTMPGWQGLVQTMALDPLDDSAAIEFLCRASINENDARYINRVTRGHPLALQLASTIAGERPRSELQDATLARVIDELARLYLEDVPDPVTRVALEASSAVRSVTLSILAAMLPDVAPQDAFERLRALPFVERGRDGLHLHDIVQQAIAESLRSSDPDRHRSYRRAAWRQLQQEVRTIGKHELWRYTADMLYLLENPIVRESFFPSGSTQYAVEPANADDHDAILQISYRHETPTATRRVELMLQQVPESIWVVREPDRSLAGFFVVITPESASRAWMRSDPLLRKWLDHLERDPVPRNQRVLFAPRNLSLEDGEAPSAVQAASWLETKRMYMELRPNLRRIYFVQRDVETTWPALRQLGFQRIPEADIELGGDIYRTTMLDFGPSSVDGWLSRLVAAELGVADDEVLNVDAQELVLDGRRVHLTRLEFAVVHYLVQHEGKPVTRQALLENVWGYSYDGGSNVVDVIIRAVRKKLDDRAHMIETVRGVGYRFNGAACETERQ